ncbi:MAG: MFS transporter [Acidobacteria bacterium]|nr:MAG: MFS transporter [Acidobacteriota bacterium]REK08883.1 MAG: MFS transporter [Acidobacteriota bacterium]
MLLRRTDVVAALEARGRYPQWVLVTALMGMFATNFSFTILTVSLRLLSDELGSSETTMAWAVTGPILFSAVALPVLGKLGDLHGHRRIYLLGSLGGAAASVATAFAWSAGSLIALRIVAGVLGGATQPSSMALIFREFAPRQRNRAMGWWSMVGAGAPALGLIAGGPLVDAFGWRIVFLLQGLFGFVALAFAVFVLRETPRQSVRFDLLGAATLTVAVGASMYGLSQARELGLTSPLLLGCFAFGAVAAVLFVLVERRVARPLLPLGFFRERNFTAPLLSNMLQGAAYMGAFVLAPFLLLARFEMTITAAALFMAIRTVSLTISSPVGGRLGERIGERRAALLGTVVITASMLVLAYGSQAGSAATLVTIGVGLMLQGVGQGVCIPPLTTALSSSVPLEDLGIATASARLMNQVGVAFGITAMTVAYGGDPNRLPGSFLLGAAISAAAVVVALWVHDVEEEVESGPDPPG